MAATAARQPYHGSIRAIWGLAKSPELSLNDEDLHALVERETGKDSIRALCQSEIDTMCRVLGNMKNDVAREVGSRKSEVGSKKGQKRTDEGGAANTIPLRHKIFALTGELGWNKNNNRVNGMCKKMFNVDRIEWLSVRQCHQLIEALKKMVDREAAGSVAEEER